MRIAVAGGTGTVGRHVDDAVAAAGHEAVVLARSCGVDVMTGDGLDAALDGVAAVVDVSNVTTLARSTALKFFSSWPPAAAGQRSVRHAPETVYTHWIVPDLAI